MFGLCDPRHPNYVSSHQPPIQKTQKPFPQAAPKKTWNTGLRSNSSSPKEEGRSGTIFPDPAELCQPQCAALPVFFCCNKLLGFLVLQVPQVCWFQPSQKPAVKFSKIYKADSKRETDSGPCHRDKRIRSPSVAHG